MRVDERNLSDPVSSPAGRTAESQRVQVATSGSAGPSAAAGDHVDLSSLAGRIAHTMQTLAHQTSQRVSQLRKDYQAGRYRPDAQQISRTMLARWTQTART
jgi:anti-sigma28 factor (negative regulator of flagellin synthesis)